MLVSTRVTLLCSGFVLLALFDLGLRFLWLEREQYICNQGVFWGMALPEKLIFGGSIALLCYLFFLLGKVEFPLARIGVFGMFLGGVVNLLDRLFSGCVLDYFPWPGFLGSFFPNFNLADMLILLGLLGLGGIFLKQR